MVHVNETFKTAWMQASFYSEVQSYLCGLCFLFYHFETPFYFLVPFSDKFLSRVILIDVVVLTSHHSSCNDPQKQKQKVSFIQTKQPRHEWGYIKNLYPNENRISLCDSMRNTWQINLLLTFWPKLTYSKSIGQLLVHYVLIKW